MSGPSPHLSWAELMCHDGTDYPMIWRGERALYLADAFEALRTRVGHPLQVLSAYRTPEYNRAIGGAKLSQHVQGRALDLKPPDGWTPEELAAVAKDIPEIMGIGVYPTFVHIDIRPGLRRVVWRGGRPMADRGE